MAEPNGRHVEEVKKFILFAAQLLVDQPDAVQVTAVASQAATIVELRVAPGKDVGIIIGQGGRNINALRRLLSAAGTKQHRKVILNFIER